MRGAAPAAAALGGGAARARSSARRADGRWPRSRPRRGRGGQRGAGGRSRGGLLRRIVWPRSRALGRASRPGRAAARPAPPSVRTVAIDGRPPRARRSAGRDRRRWDAAPTGAIDMRHARVSSSPTMSAGWRTRLSRLRPMLDVCWMPVDEVRSRIAPTVAPARAVRVRGPAPRVRGGRVGRPRAARRGGAARPRRARPRARHAAGLRHRPAPRHARPRDRGARRAPVDRARAGRARRAAARGLPARLPRPRARPRRGRGVGRARQGGLAAAAPGSSTPCCAAPPARRARWSRRCPRTRRRRPRCATRTPSGSPQLWWDALGAATARAR